MEGNVQRQSSFGFGVSEVPDAWKKLEYIFSNVPKAGTSKSDDKESKGSDAKDHGDGEFLVMGMNITKWNASSQYMFCTFGVMFFLMTYGLLQEHLIMKTFHRTLGWFVTCCQLSGYAFCAWLQSILVGVRLERRIPYRQYFILAALQVLMQGFTNLSMHYLNYPAKMLFKSSRVLVTMLVGAIFRRQTYQRKDYVVGFSMAVGLTLFVMADARTSPVFDIKGVVIICIALAADGAILNLQDHCLKRHNASHDELIYYSYTGAAVLVFLMNVYTGEFVEGCSYLQQNGSLDIFLLFMAFSAAGFLGVSCVAALTKRFGAITSAITSTVRKGLTLALSYVFYPEDKSLTIWHIFGSGIFMWGLFMRSIDKKSKTRRGSDGNIEDGKDSDIDGNRNDGEEEDVEDGRFWKSPTNPSRSQTQTQASYGNSIVYTPVRSKSAISRENSSPLAGKHNRGVLNV